jgi:hypothetical protein
MLNLAISPPGCGYHVWNVTVTDDGALREKTYGPHVVLQSRVAGKSQLVTLPMSPHEGLQSHNESVPLHPSYEC